MEATAYYSQLGRVAEAMCRSNKYCQYPLACIAIWIKPAVLLRQIHFFIDESGACLGYMTWAFLAEDAERKLLTDDDVILHVSEWNEGDRLWILDLVLSPGVLRRALREARMLFPGALEAHSLRRTDEGKVSKVTRWKLA
ncbi:toxin-activating lysine-acyltransferase [Pseudoxanthomonas wuyuanensis]|uniref:toxin-activating lysine-acyltransferase n=1 Tax=Pseudoxanthomonas wuyuanensis TaxID=1073196 RepID=UPI000BE30583|nr:toxin-activating lysine-acyltransferase [Pseudoxanthomonas wuyuanensis]